MAAELATGYIKVEWIKPLWKKLSKIWQSRDGELAEIGNVFGDPRLLAQYYIEPHCQHHNPADYDEDEGAFGVECSYIFQPQRVPENLQAAQRWT